MMTDMTTDKKWARNIYAISIFIGAALLFTTASHAEVKFVLIGDATQEHDTTAGVSGTTDGLLSFGAGGLYELGDKASRWGLETGALYFQRNPGQSGVSSSISHWLELPVLGRYHAGDASLGLGGYFAKGFGNQTTVLSGVSSSSALSSTQKTFDYGLQAALSYVIGLHVLLELRYSLGLANLASASADSLKYTDAQFFVGWRF